jgi:hypothetical protein
LDNEAVALSVAGGDFLVAAAQPVVVVGARLAARIAEMPAKAHRADDARGLLLAKPIG